MRTLSPDLGNPGTEGPEAEGDPGELACLFLTVARSRYSMWPRICSETDPPVKYVVLEVFEVRVLRAESQGRDPGEPDADGPKGGCLQDTPDITNAFPSPATQRTIQMETEAHRTIQMETEANGPFR